MPRRSYGRTEFVLITHPDVTGSGWAPQESLKFWVAKGWEVVPDEDSEQMVDAYESEWTSQGASEQEGDDEPDADEENMS